MIGWYLVGGVVSVGVLTIIDYMQLRVSGQECSLKRYITIGDVFKFVGVFGLSWFAVIILTAFITACGLVWIYEEVEDRWDNVLFKWGDDE